MDKLGGLDVSAREHDRIVKKDLSWSLKRWKASGPLQKHWDQWLVAVGIRGMRTMAGRLAQAGAAG